MKYPSCIFLKAYIASPIIKLYLFGKHRIPCIFLTLNITVSESSVLPIWFAVVMIICFLYIWLLYPSITDYPIGISQTKNTHYPINQTQLYN